MLQVPRALEVQQEQQEVGHEGGEFDVPPLPDLGKVTGPMEVVSETHWN